VLDPAWGEDETIGWIYQYFTPGELREEARKASGAPRNSYEMAFRNQFYTPRYVVAFLADNTLGRLWWEMRSGDTKLVEICQYLIQTEPSPTPKRDPRTLRILDPAVGSAHFLLYCFDLLQVIYEEAYDDADLGPALQRDYPDVESYRRAVPKLILQHNLHGIDIDRRAVQIASLALWLRAHRAYKDLGVKRKQRPPIDQIHIVDAEPMPGEYDLLGEFTRDLKPAVLGNLLREIWDKMKLAGEAGSLLKIEQEIQQAVQQAHEAVNRLPSHIQLDFFGTEVQQTLPLYPEGVDEKAFWDAQCPGRPGIRNLKCDATQALCKGCTRRAQGMRRIFVQTVESISWGEVSKWFFPTAIGGDQCCFGFITSPVAVKWYEGKTGGCH
jgi:hypothetical protein